MTNSLDVAAVAQAVSVYEENAQMADLMLTLASMGASAMKASINLTPEMEHKVDAVVSACAASAALNRKLLERAHEAADIVLGLE